MATQNAIGIPITIAVANGGTAQTTLTQYSPLIGNGATDVQSITAGTTGQLLVATTSSNPAFAASATGDFTFTSSTAGATRTFTVTNTDNTNAASTALIKAVTGGASSGDAVYQASTTTTTWSWGVDNSVTTPTADTFVIAQGSALGTNNIMSVATSGEINYPLQSAFSAYNSVADLNVTGDGTVYTVICDTETYDQNADYNNATGIFTAPVAGRYSFAGSAYLLQLAAGHTAGQLQLATTGGTYYACDANYAAMRDVNNVVVLNGSFQINMASGDTAKLNVAVFNSTKVVDVGAASALTAFSGYLMC